MKSFNDSILNKKRGVIQKSKIYIDAYTHMFSLFDLNAKLNILEIGVRDGGGVYSLKQHFPNSTICGLDIDSSCKKWEDGNDKIYIEIGNQNDENILLKVNEKYGPFDIVIDDGSHMISHQKKSFNILFPLMRNNGMYIIEDLHTSYWTGFIQEFEETAIKFFQQLSSIPTERWASKCARSKYVSEYEYSEIDRMIYSVHFYDSICFIIKNTDYDVESLILNYKKYFPCV